MNKLKTNKQTYRRKVKADGQRIEKINIQTNEKSQKSKTFKSLWKSLLKKSLKREKKSFFLKERKSLFFKSLWLFKSLNDWLNESVSHSETQESRISQSFETQESRIS